MFREKGSFLVAGRGSYAHLLLKAAGKDNSANFYDLNLKTNYNLNESNQLFLSGYFGRDAFELGKVLIAVMETCREICAGTIFLMIDCSPTYH